MAVYARDGALNTSKDKDPWTTSNYAAYSGTSYVKGRTYIWASGSTVNLRSCWTDAHTQGRWRSIHSEEYQQKMGKKDRGYY
jgi:hypothetical protein